MKKEKSSLANPVVSVCMITYNHEKFIAEAIEGVFLQEVNFDLEFLIADDCSTDKTRNIVQKYIENHPKGDWIKYVSHSINKGMMGNAIWALENCLGKYIAFCEGDDYWIDPLKLQKQVYFLEENQDFVLTFHDCKIIDSNNQVLQESRLSQNSKMDLRPRRIRYGSLIPTGTIVFRKDALPNKFSNNLLNANNGDTIFLFYLSLKGSAHFHNEFIGSVYRIHEGGVWSCLSYEDKLKKIIITYDCLRSSLTLKEKRILDETLCPMFYELGKQAEKNRDTMKNKLFIKSIIYGLSNFNFKIILCAILKLLKVV